MADITLESLVKDIQDKDKNVRAAARDGAGPVGAAAIAPLARIAATGELEVARAANRAMQQVIFCAGRPGAGEEAEAVTAELLKLLNTSQPTQLRRDILWMTWQIAGEDAAVPIAALLTDKEVGEDARMALERLPGEKATAALRAALDAADEDKKPALAHSLRVRGIDTPGVPDLRLVPTKETSVQPVKK